MFARTSTLLLLAVLALGAAGASKEKQLRDDIIACSTQPGDEVLAHFQVSDEGHNLGKASLDITYPPEDEPEATAINCIIVKDLMPNTGAVATLTSGGIGSTRITVHLESSFTKGLSFSIKLMGQR
ncbi:uncharacterized protein LOC124163611 [Ischnura elegans]|uniref:uncharacterized protein LOC124163611 n=1 Tax=Ischnura elegans TaxID=197161 RepID=UPI001ED882C2|nr:uncharacterized protein LOC124163611 [Ischnura elegans]